MLRDESILDSWIYSDAYAKACYFPWQYSIAHSGVQNTINMS